MKLIDEWKSAWKMLSVQAMGAALAIQGAWPEIPTDLKAQLPQHLVHWVSIGLLVLGIAGRLVKQPSVQAPVQAEPSSNGGAP